MVNIIFLHIIIAKMLSSSEIYIIVDNLKEYLNFLLIQERKGVFRVSKLIYVYLNDLHTV